MADAKSVTVSDVFDNIKSRDLRFLEEASKIGPLTVLLWPDFFVQTLTGKPPKFSFTERLYFLNAVRYVGNIVQVKTSMDFDSLPKNLPADVWADYEPTANSNRAASAKAAEIAYRVFGADQLKGFPEPTLMPASPGRKKVVVTGCFDWFHSGHVRFMEEVSAYGDLYVIVGHDENIRLLKGEGHPLLCQAERRYVVGSIRYVTQALISSGDGWLDADPEIRQLKPDIYAVNEEGDIGGKRDYCEKMGIEYLVLKRAPAPGLPRRSSTDLRRF